MHIELDSPRSAQSAGTAGEACRRPRCEVRADVARLRECSLIVGGELRLNRIDLTVGKGEAVAIIGPAAAGKTLLLESIEGLHVPCSGRAEVWGMDAHRLQRIHREEIGTLRTRAAWPSMLRIWQLLDLATRAAVDARVDETRLHGLRLSLGLDSIADLRLADLDDADFAAFAAWMALSRPRQLLLLDEPGEGLDVGRQRVLWQALDAQRHLYGCSVVMAGRQAALARRCDRVLYLSSGRISATRAGTAEALKARASAVGPSRGLQAPAGLAPASPVRLGTATAPWAGDGGLLSRLHLNDRERALP